VPAVLTQEICLCDECSRNKPRSQFSVANGVCLECFDRLYTFCEVCGVALRRNTRGGYYGPNARGMVHDGMNLCYDCYDRRVYDNDNRWKPTALDVSFATYDKIGSKRKYGVEVETADCHGYRRLRDRTKFGCKSDCSVSGMEFDSPILYGDEGLAYIREFLAYATDNDWYADEDCGCHTHYDMRDESFEECARVAYAYRKTNALWKSLVAQYRRNNSYSRTPYWTCADFRRCYDSYVDAVDAEHRDFAEFSSDVTEERHEICNLTAYEAHCTFEIRVLEGTCDPKLICNWITLNCRFIDAVKRMTFDEIDEVFCGHSPSQRRALGELIGDSELIEWIEERASAVAR